MISKPKTLITLTVLNPLSDTNVQFAVTDGNATLNGASGIGPYLENNFLSTVQELLQGHPANPAAPADFLYGNWPERLVKFAIDPELIKEMVARYQENGNDSSITKLDEWVINFFDKVNGNNAVSQAVGIAHLVKSFQESDSEQGSAEPEMNWSDKLTNLIYDGNAWDPDQQGVCFVIEELDNDVEIDLNVVRAVGNVFVSGSIGKVNVRIFKSQFINVYTSWDDQFNDRSTNFQLHDRGAFIEFVKGLTEATP